MPRMPKVEYAGAIYHVAVRMIGQAWETGRTLDLCVCLFGDDAERDRFLDQLGERVEAHGVRLYAYCAPAVPPSRPDASRGRHSAWDAERFGGGLSTPAPRRPSRSGPSPAPPFGRHRKGTGMLNKSLIVICRTVPDAPLEKLLALSVEEYPDFFSMSSS